MRELDEALMDRTTASQNRKHKVIHIPSNNSFQDATLRSDSHHTQSFCEEGPIKARPESQLASKTLLKSGPKLNKMETNSNKSNKQKRASKR
jgi:hypothetical protein